MTTSLYPPTHTKSVFQRTSQIMFLLKSVPRDEQITITVIGADSHNWNMKIAAEDWESMVPTIESSIDSAFRNEAFEVTVSSTKAERKERFEKSKIDLIGAFGSVVPSMEVA